MLIVIGVIIILLSLLIVGLNMAAKAAQRAHTQSLMNSIAQGLVRFKDDIGYYPPVLYPNRALYENPDDIQEWYSYTTLAEYLIGYGPHREDGYGYDPGLPPNFDWDGEQPPTGIRHPRADGVWGATMGAGTGIVADRMRDASGNYGSEQVFSSFDQGKVYGPYIELQDEDVVGALVEVQPDVYEVRFPGEAGYDEDLPKAIADYWGEPIAFYRRPYPPGALTQSYRAIDYDLDGEPDSVPTLSNVFCLRPFAVEVGAEADTVLTDGSGDTTTSFRLESAEFAVLSKGPDRGVDRAYRRDPDELNRDNIVEVGP
jgi:hypothetical protein